MTIQDGFEQPGRPRDPWRALLWLPPLVLLTYASTLGGVLRLWTDWEGAYAHGLPILLMAAVLSHRSWSELRVAQPPRFSPLGALVLLLASLIWAGAVLGNVQSVQQGSLLLVAAGLLWALWGLSSARRFFVPLVLVATALPLWGFLAAPLQRLTAAAVLPLLHASAIPAAREGLVLSIPNGDFTVARECSGLSQLLIAVALTLVWTGMGRSAPRARIVLPPLAVAVAVAANLLRVYLVVVMAHHWGMDHPWVQDHGWIGWSLFGAAMFLFLLAAGRAGGRWAEAAAPPRPWQAAPLGGRRLWPVPVAAALAGPLLVAGVEAMPAAPCAPPSAPTRLAGHRPGDALPAPGWRPYFPDAAAVLHRGYLGADGQPLVLFVAYYPQQRQGAEVVHYSHRIDDGAIWSLQGEAQRLDGPAGTGLHSFTRSSLRTTRGRGLEVWHCYLIDGACTADPWAAKLLGVWARLRGRPQAAFVAVAMPASKAEGGSAALAAGVEALAAQMRRCGAPG